MELTHAYMTMLYQQLAHQHAAIAQLQDDVLRLNKENITLKAEAQRQRDASPEWAAVAGPVAAATTNGQHGGA